MSNGAKLTAFLVKYDWGRAYIAEFSYEKITNHSYLGARLVKEVSGMGSCYIPRSGRIPKEDVTDTPDEAFRKAIASARKDMESRKLMVNKINSCIGQLESTLRKIEGATGGHDEKS